MESQKIERAVKEFFNGRRFCYANPETETFATNFYGDTPVCKLTRRDVIMCIEMARDNWTWDDDDALDTDDREQMAIDHVLDDMQFDKP
jgi:hypothetical protein